MATKTKIFYPTTITQTNSSNERQFSNLNNIKKVGDYSSTGLIAGKTGTRNKPSKITATNFKVNLPTGSEITSIKVEYSHQKVAYQGGIPNIPQPTIDLVGVTATAKKGKAPTTKMAQQSVTFKVAPSLSKVTSSGFGVSINYPKNTNTNPGYLRLKFIRVIVSYKEPSFSLTLQKVGTSYKNDTVDVKCTLSNKNGTGYNPNVNISLPVNVSYSKYTGDGTVTRNGAGLVWNPKLSGKVNSRSVTLTLNCNTVSTGNTVKFTEPSTKLVKSISFDISEEPVSGDDDESPGGVVTVNDGVGVISGVVGESVELNIDVSNVEFPTPYSYTREDEQEARLVLVATFDGYNQDLDDGVTDDHIPNPSDIPGNAQLFDTTWDNTNHTFIMPSKVSMTLAQPTIWSEIDILNIGYAYLAEDNTSWDSAFTVISSVYINPIPNDLTLPQMSLLQLTQEELNRLGDGYDYTIQSYIKINSTESYVRDWGKNFRIGVFNNPILENQTIFNAIDEETGETYKEIIDSTDYNSLSVEDIYTHADYWSNPPTTAGEYNNITCDFVYEEDYPLYIIITGDYFERADFAFGRKQISFSEPCIMEDYENREPNGNYPIPILTTLNSETTATLNIPEYQQSSPIIAYNIPLEELDENIVIKGITVSMDIEYSDQLILSCKLRNNKGKTGERSININPISDNTITLGDSTDRWGFKETDLTKFTDWSIELQANNLFDNEQNQSTIILNNIIFTLHVTELDTQVVNCYIDGENLAGYNAFITDIEVPQGLETDVKYLNIDGTDTNNAYRQNIKEKEIKIKFDIDACTIDEATTYLNEITALLVNERDNLNNPIPKTLTLSHYPGIYWEYILEKTIKAEAKAASYECDATLTIPAGTAFTTEEITTGPSGKVNGVAKINPTLTIIPTNDHIEITETLSGQKWTMTYNNWSNTDTVEINTANRQVQLNHNEEITDITAYTDYNSDWFKIHGDYQFTSEGCIIQTISRIERR
jgi:hypothetical protein